MRHSSLIRSICGLVVCAFVAAGGRASAECLRGQPISLLAAEMRVAASGRAPSLPESSRRVARQIEYVNLVRVAGQLNQANLAEGVRHVERLLFAARAFGGTARVTDSAALLTKVEAVEKLIELSCGGGPSFGSGDRAFDPSRLADRVLFAEDGGAALRVGGLIFLLATAIGSLLLIENAVKHVFGVFSHKKTCKIPARLLGGGEEIAGQVTRASLYGVRFEPGGKTELNRLKKLLATPDFIEFTLEAADRQWPIYVDGCHGFFSPLYFLARLTRKDLTALLKRSSTPPKNAPYIGRKVTHGKWRSEIKDRKKRMREASRLRDALRQTTA